MEGITHNLKEGDFITEGQSKDVYLVTRIDDAGYVHKLCVTPSSADFGGVGNGKIHIVQVATGFKRITYTGDIADPIRALKRLVGAAWYRPALYRIGSVRSMEKVIVTNGMFTDTISPRVSLPNVYHEHTLSVPEFFASKCTLPDTCVLGVWVDKNGYRPSDFTGESIECHINHAQLQDYAVATVNMRIRKINSPETVFKKIQVTGPNGIVLSDDTFISNAELSEYVTSEGKRLIRCPGR